MFIPIGIIRTRAEELGIVALGLGARRIERQVETGEVEDGRYGIGHGQQHGHTASQRGGRAGVPVFFVSLAGFAQMYVWVDQSGEFYHRHGKGQGIVPAPILSH